MLGTAYSVLVHGIRNYCASHKQNAYLLYVVKTRAALFKGKPVASIAQSTSMFLDSSCVVWIFGLVRCVDFRNVILRYVTS